MIHSNSGTIVNVSFGAGKTGFENLSAYCTSKFGILDLTKSLAWEVADTIRVMAICSGECLHRHKKLTPINTCSIMTRCLSEKVAVEIVEMKFDEERYKNGQS
jgi:3-oxoacyl-[acyl-carrier protein] reductase